MLRKKQRPFSLTSWQVQQLKRISHRLRKLNRAARRELRRMGHTGLTRTQHLKAGDLFGTIATLMISALRFRDEILKAEQPQQPFQLNVRFVAPCVHHVHRPQSRQLAGHDDDEAQREALHPAHQAEVASLLESTNSIEERVSRRSILRGAPLNKFRGGIDRLKLAVLRQQQYLLAIAPPLEGLFKLYISDVPKLCADCLKSKEFDGMMEGATDRSDESFTEGSLPKDRY